MAKKKKSSNKKKKHSILKKIARGTYYCFSKAYNIIDKIIITPIAKFMLWITKPFKNSSKPLDRLLNNKGVLLTLSLVISLIAFFHYDNIAERLMNNSADILYNQKVTALYNEEAYVIEGLPDTVDITLIGRKSDLYLAKQYPSDGVTVDLRGLKPGKHQVEIKYDSPVSSVNYKADPSTATVTIYEKLSISKKISTEILNADSINQRYNISNITFSSDEVYVKGAEYMLDKVATVKALVNLEKLELNIGTATLKDIPLVAYDENGNKLDVEIVPGTIDATLEISSPSKEVPLRVVPTGNVVFGKAIDDIKLSKTQVTIYGNEEDLEKISYVPVNIDVEGIDKKTEYTINLSAPSGVKEMSVKSVVATVTLADEKEKTIDNVNIAIRNLDSRYTAQAASRNDSFATIIVKGSANNLEDITAENITAYVDLKGKGRGTHKVEVQVTGEDLKLTYTPKTTTVTIIIE